LAGRAALGALAPDVATRRALGATAALGVNRRRAVHADAPLGLLDEVRLIDRNLCADSAAPAEAGGLWAINRLDAHAHDRATRHVLETSDIEAGIDEAPVELVVGAEGTRAAEDRIGVSG